MAAPRRASAPAPTLLLHLLLLLLIASAAAAAAAEGGGATHLHFYFHENFSGGPNGTTAQLTNSSSRASAGGSFFGATFAIDDALRDGPDPASALVGRAQGLTVAASLSDGALLTVLDLVFTDGPYSGSTLQVLGRALLSTAMERPIVGGTGAFRMARGYTLSKRITSPDPNNLLILEYDAYVYLD